MMLGIPRPPTPREVLGMDMIDGIMIDEYAGAIGEEKAAIRRYNRMILNARSPEERKLMIHIRDEEIEHLKELSERTIHY